MATSGDEAAELRIRDLLLSALTVSSGAVDAISYLALGRIFSAFMTGNGAFLGLGVAGAGGPGVVSVAIPMAAFAGGVYLAARMAKPSEHPGTWPHQATIALSASLIPHAAFLIVWFANGGEPTMRVTRALLALWALAMGMQSVAVQALHVEGVLSTAATGAFILLFGDFAHWSATTAERRLLAGILISLFSGAVAGGLLLVYAHLYAPLLPFLLTTAAVETAAVVMKGRVAAGRSR